MDNTCLNNNYVILNGLDMIDSGAIPMAANIDVLAEQLEFNGDFDKFKNRNVLCNNKSLNLNNLSHRTAIICYAEVNDQTVLVGVSHVDGRYHLLTIETKTGQTIYGGEVGLMKHFDFDQNLKNIFKHIVGYDNRLQLHFGIKCCDKYTIHEVNALNSSIKFVGKLVSSEDNIDRYEVKLDSHMGSIMHNTKTNKLTLNILP